MRDVIVIPGLITFAFLLIGVPLAYFIGTRNVAVYAGAAGLCVLILVLAHGVNRVLDEREAKKPQEPAHQTQPPRPGIPTLTLGCSNIAPFQAGQAVDGVPLSVIEIKEKSTGKVFPFLSVVAIGDTIYPELAVMRKTGGVGFFMRSGEPTVTGPNWDMNRNEGAVEVVDDRGVVVFQMMRTSKTAFEIRGAFPISDVVVVIGPPNSIPATLRGQAAKNFAVPEAMFPPIFKYPSWKFPGQVIDPPLPQPQCGPGFLGKTFAVSKALVITTGSGP